MGLLFGGKAGLGAGGPKEKPSHSLKLDFFFLENINQISFGINLNC